MAKPILDDDLRTLIEPMLPPPKPRFRYPGRKPITNRQALTGIIFVLRTGIPWELAESLAAQSLEVSVDAGLIRRKHWSDIQPRLNSTGASGVRIQRVLKLVCGRAQSDKFAGIDETQNPQDCRSLGGDPGLRLVVKGSFEAAHVQINPHDDHGMGAFTSPPHPSASCPMRSRPRRGHRAGCPR